MLLISKEKFTSILNSTFQFISIIAVSQLLVSCCASKTAFWGVKSFYHNNKPTDVKTTVLSKKNQVSKINQKKREAGGPLSVNLTKSKESGIIPNMTQPINVLEKHRGMVQIFMDV